MYPVREICYSPIQFPPKVLFPPKERVGVQVANIEGKSFWEILSGGNLRVEQVFTIPVNVVTVIRRLAARNIKSNLSGIILDF